MKPLSDAASPAGQTALASWAMERQVVVTDESARAPGPN
jgi:hypothetical protein